MQIYKTLLKNTLKLAYFLWIYIWAWFEATTSFETKKQDIANTLDVEKVGTISVGDQTIKFTYSVEADVDLIDSLTNHNTYYVYQDEIRTATSANQIGKFKITSIEWDTGTGYDITAIKAAFGGKKITIRVDAGGEQSTNIKFLPSDNPGNGAWSEVAETVRTFKISCDANGGLTWDETTNASYLEGAAGSKTPFGYYCVLANSGHNATSGTDTAEASSDYDVELVTTITAQFA